MACNTVSRPTLYSCWSCFTDGKGPFRHSPLAILDRRMAGYFFHPRSGSTTGAGPRPTIILNNGSDGPVTDMVKYGAAAAVERGWNALTFDGPGQNAALHRQKLYFRPDWEAVITPVVDWLTASAVST